MVKDTELKIYQKIQIEVDEELYQGEYLSRVAEKGEGYIKVSAPFKNGEIVPLRINLPVRISFTGERAAYFFDTLITGRENEPLPVLIIDPPGELKRIQRRQFFRLEVKRDVRYRLLGPEEEWENVVNDPEQDNEGRRRNQVRQGIQSRQGIQAGEGSQGRKNERMKDREGEFLQTTTIDISGGGLEIAVDEDIPDGTMMEIFVDIPGMEDKRLIGKVVQHYDLPDGKAVGIFFPEIEDNDRDRVIQWLFKHQRELRQRGIL